MTQFTFSEAMMETVKTTVRKLEAQTNIQFNLSPIPEELEIRDSNIKKLEGHFIGYLIVSDVSAVRFNFKLGFNIKSPHIYSCDVWLKEGSFSKPNYTVLLNPNAKSEISGGLRTISDLLLGKKTMLEKEARIRYVPKVIQEKTQNDIEDFIDAVGIENLKSDSLSKIYNQYELWADADDKRIISKPQFNRVFKDILVRKRVVSDTVSTGHIYPGALYRFISNSEEHVFFNDEIIKNKIYYRAKMVEIFVTRMAQGDPDINGLLICGQSSKSNFTTVKANIKAAGALAKTVFIKDIYGFAGFIRALWENRTGKILVFNNSDILFSKSNSTIKQILQSLLSKEGNRVIRYARPEIVQTATQRKKEAIDFLLSEAKTIQPKPNTMPKDKIDDILDSEDKIYNTEEKGIPDLFEFKSKVVFITNFPTIPEGYQEIPFAAELNYTKEQALSLVEANLNNIMVDFPDFNLKRKREVLRFMRDNRATSRYFDYNTFWHIAMIYMSGLKSWKRWGLVQLTGRFIVES